jgi:hypothetical protein
MNLSAIRKFVLFPIIASAGIFAAMSLPLVLFGDKPVSIRFEEEPIFDGKLRDVAPPYVDYNAEFGCGSFCGCN